MRNIRTYLHAQLQFNINFHLTNYKLNSKSFLRMFLEVLTRVDAPFVVSS